jgi:hypothetical protein
MSTRIGRKIQIVKDELATSLDQGLKKAALLLQAEAQKRCPVDTGDLRESAFTRKIGSVTRIVYQVGFSQSYAVYVHEMLDTNFKVGQAKYLEEPYLLILDELHGLIRGEFTQ